MTSTRMTVGRRLAVAATAAAAAVLPFQMGVAHAATPDDNLSACVSAAIDTMGDTFSADVDACVNAYLAERGIDPATTALDAPATVPDGPAVTTVAGSGDDSASADTIGTVDVTAS